MNAIPNCTHPGCTRAGAGCYVLESSPAPDDWLCPQHAADLGYCKQCGLFAEGMEWFAQVGLCDVCADDPGW